MGAVLVVGAAGLTAVTPTDDALDSAFDVHGAFGDRIESRNLIVTASDAIFADEVAGPDPEWSAEGNWLVVTLAASAPTTEVDAAIQLASLAVDGRVFHASERPSATLKGAALRVGLDTVGTLAFELPADLTSGTAELRLTPAYFTPELDDLVTISLDLGSLSRADTLDLAAPEWSTP